MYTLLGDDDSNIKANFLIAPLIEYNIFPYKEVNNKSLTFGYMPEFRHNSYYDTTIYDKTTEFLTGQTVFINVSLNQKWGQFSDECIL